MRCIRLEFEHNLTRRLVELGEPSYADFVAKLLPGYSRELIIGVRLPKLRALAKNAFGTLEAGEFLDLLPHRYFDENNLHAALLMLETRDIEKLLVQVEEFLPYIDNWATCDMLRPALFALHPKLVYSHVKKWLAGSHAFTVRFAITTLINFYLGENYLREQSDLCAGLQSSEYYVNMALAWYFAEGLVRRPDDFIPYFERRQIANPWVLAKAVQKARESRRVPRELAESLAKMTQNRL